MKNPVISVFHLALTVVIVTASLTNGVSQKFSRDVVPFKISVSQADLNDLNRRLDLTRWPRVIKGTGWDYGTNHEYLKELVSYWRHDFQWKAIESNLNLLPQFIVPINNVNVHFLYIKGNGKNSTPLVLLHGWPSSFVQMTRVIPMLTTADQNDNSFDLIIPSLIGYGFSSASPDKGMAVHSMAEIFNVLLTEKLGIKKFMIRASDIGAGVAKEWALSHADNVMGLHLSGSNPYTFQVPENLSMAEKQFLDNGQKFMMAEGAYAMQQSTKPQTLAYGLNDSPVGLASWILEKYNSWSDNGGKVETKFSKNDLLTTISIYWFTQTIGSSINSYYESAHVWSPHAGKKVTVPTAFMMLSKDIAVAPREWEERSYTIKRWNTHSSGGHFGEWEEPEVIAADLKAFRDQLK